MSIPDTLIAFLLSLFCVLEMRAKLSILDKIDVLIERDTSFSVYAYYLLILYLKRKEKKKKKIVLNSLKKS